VRYRAPFRFPLKCYKPRSESSLQESARGLAWPQTRKFGFNIFMIRSRSHRSPSMVNRLIRRIITFLLLVAVKFLSSARK
jgi:hypothetical protein